MAACRERNLPLFLANARLSEKSQRGYLKAASLIRPALAVLKGCYVQTEADAGRLKSLGAADPKVCGNTKYDISPPPEQLEKAAEFKRKIGGRPTAVCGSTRFYRDQDEAELLLRAWQSYRGDALLVIVPRHPERFEAVFQTALTLGFRTQKRSDGQAVAADTQVWIGDSMGELYAYYAAADAPLSAAAWWTAVVRTSSNRLPAACRPCSVFPPTISNKPAAAQPRRVRPFRCAMPTNGAR